MTGAATGGAAGQGDGGQGEAQQGGEAAGTGPDFGALSQTLAQQGETLESMREFLQSAPWQQIQEAGQDPQEPAEPEMDLGFLDPEQAAMMDPQELSQRLGQTIQTQAEAVAQRMLQQEVGPLREQMNEQRRQSETQALIGEFPELAEAETAQNVLQVAGQLAEQLGNPALADEPAFWRLAYMAGRAADAAQEEGEDVPSPQTLESGAGATPGGGAGDRGDQIVNAGRGGSSVLPF